MHGMGYAEAAICTDWPMLRFRTGWPSIDTSAGARDLGLIAKRMPDEDGRIKDRNESDLGQTGVITIARAEGCTIGPPHDRE